MTKPLIVSIIAAGPAENSSSNVVWQLGKVVPGDTDNIINKILLVGDFIEIFASPLPNTEAYNLGICLQFIFPLVNVKIVASGMPTAEWIKLMKEAEEYDDIEEEEEEEEENVPVLQTVPQIQNPVPQNVLPNFVPPTMPPVPNGFTGQNNS